MEFEHAAYLNLLNDGFFAHVVVACIDDADSLWPSLLGSVYGSPEYALSTSSSITAYP